MKSFILSFNFIILTLTVLPLSLCSKDDNEAPTPVSNFEPVTLDLGLVELDLDDTMFELNGYAFKAYRVKSTNLGGNGILLAYPDENSAFSTIELNLTNATGISKISIALFNNCSGCLDIQLLNGSQVVREVKGTEIQSGETDVELDVNSTITALKIGSLETTVNTIILE